MCDDFLVKAISCALGPSVFAFVRLIRLWTGSLYKMLFFLALVNVVAFSLGSCHWLMSHLPWLCCRTIVGGIECCQAVKLFSFLLYRLPDFDPALQATEARQYFVLLYGLLQSTWQLRAFSVQYAAISGH